MRNRTIKWIALLAVVALIGGCSKVFFHWPRIQVFPSQFSEDAYLRWKTNNERVTDIADIANHYLRPGMDIAECQSVFQTLGLEERYGPGTSEPQLPPIEPLYGIQFLEGGRKPYFYAEAVVGIELKFSDGKLVGLVGSINKNHIYRK